MKRYPSTGTGTGIGIGTGIGTGTGTASEDKPIAPPLASGNGRSKNNSAKKCRYTILESFVNYYQEV